MITVTLVGESQAKEGNRFRYLGKQPECEGCRLCNVCLKLEKGSVYEITGVRGQTHECALIEDKVRIVEVKKVPFDSVVPKKSAIEGSLITFQEPECSYLSCGNQTRCHPIGVGNRKYSISKIEGNAACPAGHDLVLVKLL